MSARQQQNGTMSPEQIIEAQEQLAALQEQGRVLEQERAGLHKSLITLNEKTGANFTAQQLIVTKLKAASIALLGDTKLQAQLQLPKPGQLLPGTELIFITAYEPTNRKGEALGRQLAFFGAPENLPGQPQNFNRNIAAISNLTDWHGASGWKFDRKLSGTSSYEDARFKGYQDGSAIGKWGAPELPLVNGTDRYGRVVSSTEHMLAFNKDQTSPFYNSFVTIPGSNAAKWSQACTEHRDHAGNVHTVHFPGGGVTWDFKDGDTNRSCVRPGVALELNHLTL